LTSWAGASGVDGADAAAGGAIGIGANRQLDLARFLKGVEKRKNAEPFYLSFLEVFPKRLDVVRELAELYLDSGLSDKANALLQSVDASGAEGENLLDLAQFAVDEQFSGAARTLLESYIGEGKPSFEAGLLLVRVLGEIGEQRKANEYLESMHGQADTEARYSQWLAIGMNVHETFDTTDTFFDNEQNRFSFTDEVWDPIQAEKFLLLCEAGRRHQLAARVAQSIRNQLADGKLSDEQKVQLRRLLVQTLQKDSEKAQEVEALLKGLAQDDSAFASYYDLQRAVLYENSQRPDLAAALFEKIEFSEVNDSDLIRDALTALIDHGDKAKVGEALRMITEIEPNDLYAWERRLAFLAVDGQEDEFRGVIRSLLQGIAQRGGSGEWRNDTKKALRLHLLDSYWRSVALLVSDGDDRLAEVLPLLDAVDRESQGDDVLWSRWARAFVLGRLGRDTAQNESLEWLKGRALADPELDIQFPDGLSMPLLTAVENLRESGSKGMVAREVGETPLLDTFQVDWAFEIADGALVVDVKSDGDAMLVLDNQNSVYRVESQSGKLLWKRDYDLSEAPQEVVTHSGAGRLFGGAGAITLGGGVNISSTNFHFTNPSFTNPRMGVGSAAAQARRVRQLLVAGQVYFLASSNDVRAYSSKNAELLWIAELPAAERPASAAGVIRWDVAQPQMQFDLERNRLISYRPEDGLLVAIHAQTGKLLWEKSIARTDGDGKPKPRKGTLASMNSGIVVQG
ncbi:MAG: PQQ-binding-like beta-propeller repeat protein, partial [Verrucomicrobiota bacterium]